MIRLFSNSLKSCRNIADLRELARRRVPAPMFHYIDGAAGDEWTLRDSTAAFDRWNLVPRTLVDVSRIDTGTTVLFATHDRTLLDVRPRRVVVLDDGRAVDVPSGLGSDEEEAPISEGERLAECA